MYKNFINNGISLWNVNLEKCKVKQPKYEN